MRGPGRGDQEHLYSLDLWEMSIRAFHDPSPAQCSQILPGILASNASARAAWQSPLLSPFPPYYTYLGLTSPSLRGPKGCQNPAALVSCHPASMAAVGGGGCGPSKGPQVWRLGYAPFLPSSL